MCHFRSLDFDECKAHSHDCQQSCVNTQGSFRCECHSGFILQRDRKSCEGIVTLHLLNQNYIKVIDEVSGIIKT